MNLNYFESKLLKYIQLPESAYEEAANRYKSVGDFLTSEASPLNQFSPDIKTQGSFRLGTAIYPQSRDKEFDLDLTLKCDTLTPDNITQKDFRALTKRTVQMYADRQGMDKVEEKRRCVRLNYKSSTVSNSSFHIDIVPAIYSSAQEQESIRFWKGLYADKSILITDNKRPDFACLHGKWQSSNPEGYALWFESCMREEMITGKRSLLTVEASIDDIPTWRITTGLQSAVQLMKWHRDKMFDKNPDVKPTSIIITTLAGMAYLEAPQSISEMITKMSTLLQRMNGTVKNPVDPREDFTDKWKEPAYKDYHLKENFECWLSQAYTDFKAIENDMVSPSVAGEILRNSFNYKGPDDLMFKKPEIIINKPISKPYGY